MQKQGKESPGRKEKSERTEDHWEEEFGSDLDAVEAIEERASALLAAIGFDGDTVERMKLAAREAAVNAMNHGNRDNRDKKIFFEFVFDKASRTAIFRITDEGEGFKPEEVPDPLAEENILNTSGRGLYLIKQSADSVDFDDGGRTIVFTKKLGGTHGEQ